MDREVLTQAPSHAVGSDWAPGSCLDARGYSVRECRAIVILLSAFLISLVALGVFIWSMRPGLPHHDAAGARVIFSANEVGHAEDPAAEPGSLAALQNAVELRAGRRNNATVDDRCGWTRASKIRAPALEPDSGTDAKRTVPPILDFPALGRGMLCERSGLASILAHAVQRRLAEDSK
jgi:hypothetical protein